MITKDLENYFKPKIEELEKLKRQKELLEKFPGEIFIETLTDEGPLSIDSKSLKRTEFVSRDYSLADRFKIIEGFGHYNGYRVNYSNDDRFCILDLYFELDDDKSDLILPIHCRHENISLDEMNIIYRTFTSYSGHYYEFDNKRRFHPKPLDEIIRFYESRGVKKELLFEVYSKLNEIRKENPVGRIIGGRVR